MSSVISSKCVKLDHVPTFQFHFDRSIAGRQILYEYLSVLTCHLVQKRRILQEAGSSETIFALISCYQVGHSTARHTSPKGEPAKHARAVNSRQIPTTGPGKDFQKNGQRLLGIPPCTNICYFIHFHFFTIKNWVTDWEKYKFMKTSIRLERNSERLRKISIDKNFD